MDRFCLTQTNKNSLFLDMKQLIKTLKNKALLPFRLLKIQDLIIIILI